MASHTCAQQRHSARKANPNSWEKSCADGKAVEVSQCSMGLRMQIARWVNEGGAGDDDATAIPAAGQVKTDHKHDGSRGGRTPPKSVLPLARDLGTVREAVGVFERPEDL
jgi:hypothetical protein